MAGSVSTFSKGPHFRQPASQSVLQGVEHGQTRGDLAGDAGDQLLAMVQGLGSGTGVALKEIVVLIVVAIGDEAKAL